jgi:rhodanese-related sulfurtransferase
LTANEAANLIRDQSPLILDVRTPQEYSSGRIENSFLIPVQELQTRYAELSEYKNDDIFVYCATGNRSTVAAKILIDNGFTRIHNLRYGIYEWAKNGLPVIR